MNRPPRFSMIRSFHLADWLTLGNAACGMAAILAAMAHLRMPAEHSLLRAAAFIPFALLFDVLDGRVARWRQSASVLGRELDSLADVIAFGAAPAAIAFAVGMDGLWDRAVLLYFVACGVSRLARYNVTAEAFAQATGKVTYFEGTPIPTSALLVLVLAAAVWQGRTGPALWFGAWEFASGTLHPLVLLYALSGSLMISTIRIPKP